MRKKLLDLYCCQGGAARGYQLAGWHVTGIDLSPQPRYRGDFFHHEDAVRFVLARLAQLRQDFEAVHASPPCQHYSKAQRIQGNSHPDLIGPTRKALERLGLPYVIENVEDAREELKNPVTLCGTMFGLHTYRHRLFETGNGFTFEAPEHPAHTEKTVKMGRRLKPGDFYHAVGNFTNVSYVRQDMGVPWMNRDGVRECIPPAYTEFIGKHLLLAL